MNPTNWRDWLRALASEAIEGAADAYIIVGGGSSLAEALNAESLRITLGQLAYSALLGAGWYMAAWLKTHPLPASVRSSASVPSVSNP